MCGFTDYRGTVRKCDDGVGVGGGTVWRDDVIDARERVRVHREEMDGERQREQWREIKRHSSTEFMLMNDNEAFRYKQHH